MDLEDSMLSELSQAWKDNDHYTLFVYGFLKVDLKEEDRIVREVQINIWDGDRKVSRCGGAVR
jgi:hypothetical protein